MKHLVFGLALAVALAGCQANLPVGPGANMSNSGTLGASPLKLGNLQFQPVSAETAARMSQQNTAGNRSAVPAAAPMAESAGDAAVGAKMIAPGGYGYGGYFGGPFGQMKLDSMTEAKAAGAKGSWSDIQANVIAPVVAEWAPDARLVHTNGALDADGNMIEGKETYPGELAWHATYASAGRNEVLEFHISAMETQVIKLHWSPVNMDVSNLQVDAKQAIAKLTAAIKDASVKSKEEELGHDYFFGKDGGGNVGIAVPAIAVDAGPATTRASEGSAEPGVSSDAPVGMPAPDVYQPPKEEAVYSLAAGGRWWVNLQAINDHLVWELNYNPKPDETMQARNPGDTFVDNYAYGMIDARTGELIRLRRPMKITIPNYPTSPEPMPRPEPAKL